MPLWFPQSILESLFLNNAKMVASRRSDGISSISQMLLSIPWNVCRASLLTALNISAEIPSLSGALPLLICLMAFLTSSMEGGSSRSSMTALWGIWSSTVRVN